MSKFSSLAGLKKQPPLQPPETRPAKRRVEPLPTIPEQPRAVKPVEPAQSVAVGKRNNPAYVQRTAYIRKTTDHAVKLKLLQQGGEKEFSELVEELLATWLQD
jgi:hypothetical protein